MDKITARKVVKERLTTQLSFDDRHNFSAKILENLQVHLAYLRPRSVFVFMGTSTEPETGPIISYLFAKGIRVYIPKMCGADMKLTEITAATYSYSRNKYGIMEVDEKGVDKFDVDVNLVPLVAFDQACNRCGHGGGNYDRYLSAAVGVNIGLAFSMQEVDSLECESFDVPLKKIITENGVIEAE